MATAVISDVHSNLQALTAVLNDIELHGANNIVSLGDTVGYGPNPNECVTILSEVCSASVCGNHDRAAVGLDDSYGFNPFAAEAIAWTQRMLTEFSRRYLAGLPFKANESIDNLELVHSAPCMPERWRYLLYGSDSAGEFKCFKVRICMVGHSHIPFIMSMDNEGDMQNCGMKAVIDESSRYIINAGSVGQPRDGDPRACYALIDNGEVILRRVHYDIAETQKKMVEAGLPNVLSSRLAIGR